MKNTSAFGPQSPGQPYHPNQAGRHRAALAIDKGTQQLIESCQGLVRTLAWKIHRKVPASVEIDDLISYGQVGLAQAARDFEAGKGNQFTTYAYHRIRGAILDGLSQMSWFSRHDYHSCRYEQMANDVMRLDGDASATTTPAEAAGNIGWFVQLATSLSVAYLASYRDRGGEDTNCLEDTTRAQPGDEICQREIFSKLDGIIEQLPNEARTLIRATYFEGVTLQEAGARLGISKSWASRLHAKTLLRLAQSLRLAGISG